MPYSEKQEIEILGSYRARKRKVSGRFKVYESANLVIKIELKQVSCKVKILIPEKT